MMVTGFPPDVSHHIFKGIVPFELSLCLQKHSTAHNKMYRVKGGKAGEEIKTHLEALDEQDTDSVEMQRTEDGHTGSFVSQWHSNQEM
ncbi:hypothetical protein AAFF_G00387960 [Aldrovandia affinis]|uniref:Uncharacterized protein n=1 Tax=Aldrovandia affinis TaxID=143900 RepID=A0AAD7SEP3_9TELE|nr:hypothetical protein AAFF_G00387960 [Aldrovandia affinis]